MFFCEPKLSTTLKIEDINEILYRKEKENTELETEIEAED